MLSISDTTPGVLSGFLSVCAIVCWIFVLFPQQLRNYKRKSVKGLSPYLLLFLFLGDFLNMMGCILTHQLPFQLYNSCYAVSNDVILLFQYWYYGTYIKNQNKLISENDISDDASLYNEEMMENSIGSLNSNLISSGLLMASQITTASAMPVNTDEILMKSLSQMTIGRFIAYCCAFCYITCRLPQLHRNYHNKSTRGTSPYFHGLAIIGCGLYASSILTSNQFLFNHDPVSKWDFFNNEFPYLLSNFGSILLDLCFFYQYFTYGDHLREREVDRILEISEATALLG
ncbi:Ypq2 protein [Saccharomycopsis crataegensis]|uniref:Ypq2 protein n=1 Tax=Saccharomycopsis crataegensis TaxID=43959 RepID=A0AAV5QNP7_9ASCO|nr:Ypq2 protein [Saccharomycopsis crataegensis]